jgi:predicted  nucleic acid-binding Zn-ribbon protein
MKNRPNILKVEFETLEGLRKDLTYRIDEIESLQTELQCLKNIRQKLDTKITELKTKLQESSPEKSPGSRS